jgi:hypothetical protein
MLTSFWCKASVGLEQAMEEEFWQLALDTDPRGMNRWIDDAKQYIAASRTPAEPRLRKLMGFGGMMVYLSRGMLTLSGLTELLDVLAQVEKAHHLAPADLNVTVLRKYLQAYMRFALYDDAGGMNKVEEMLALPEQVGVAGSEGEVVGAMSLALLTDPAHAMRALDLLDDCTTDNCKRTSWVAPSKEIGMRIVVAEAYAKTGQLDEMRRMLDETRALALLVGWPYLHRLDEVEDELTRPGGLVEQWQAGTQRIGYVQLPLPPSASVSACAFCHHGVQVPANLYAR